MIKLRVELFHFHMRAQLMRSAHWATISIVIFSGVLQKHESKQAAYGAYVLNRIEDSFRWCMLFKIHTCCWTVCDHSTVFGVSELCVFG